LPKTLIVNNKPFSYPTKGDEPGWGSAATGWAEEVTSVLNDVIGPDDILESSFNVVNNQVAFTDVIGLIFNTASVRSAIVQYSVYRISTANPSGFAETGEMRLIYDNNIGWSIAIGNVVGNSGVDFDITAGGQIQYKSNDINSLNYSGVIHFRAKALAQ
jgi:hypothetical protein